MVVVGCPRLLRLLQGSVRRSWVGTEPSLDEGRLVDAQRLPRPRLRARAGGLPAVRVVAEVLSRGSLAAVSQPWRQVVTCTSRRVAAHRARSVSR